MEEKNFVSKIIEVRKLIIILIAIVFIAGIVCYEKMPKQRFPKVVLPVASITAIYPGASASEMQELVARKIEETAMEIEGFEKSESVVKDNYVVTTVSLNMEVTKEEAKESFDKLKDLLEERKSQFPAGLSSITVNDEVMDTAGILVTISGDGISNDELSQRAREVSDKLRYVDGVKKVKALGDVPSKVVVRVDYKKLNDLNVSLAEIEKLISYHNQTLPTGSITSDGENIDIYTSGKFESLEDIKNIIVASNKEHIITRLSDIASVEMEVPEDESFFMYNNERAILLAVYFNDGINVVSLGDEISSILQSFDDSFPEGVNVKPIFMQPQQVEKSINDFIVNLIESIVLVILVVMLGMNFRNALVVSVAIPLAIFSSFVVTYFAGFEIHFVSLASLIVVLGMLVDNAVVVSDAIQKNLDQGIVIKKAVISGTRSVVFPVFVSMVTTCIAFSSILVLPGAYRQLSISFPVVIICCLVASFIVSIFVTPIMSFYFLKKQGSGKEVKAPKYIRFYKKIFEKAYTHKKLTLLISSLFVVALCVLSLGIDMEIVPKANDNFITIEVKANSEDNLFKTQLIANKVRDVLKEDAEVEYVLTGVGEGIPRYDYSILPKMPSESLADLLIKVDLEKGGRFKKTSQMVDYLQQKLESEVGSCQILVDELGIFASNTKPVEVKIFSDDISKLNESARIINSYIKEIDGTKGIISGNEVGRYAFDIEMDKLKLNSLSLMEMEAQNELNIAIMGRDVSSFKKGDKEYSINLCSNIETKEDISSFEVKSSISNEKFALFQFAEINLKPSINYLSRVDGQKGRVISCFVNSGTSNIVAQTELEKMIEKNKGDFPEGVKIEFSGMKKQFFDEVLYNIGVASIVAIAVMLFILILQFSDIKKVGIIFVSVPFGLASGIFALKILGQPLSLFALIGGVSLLGCVLANAIVLIDCINNEIAGGLSVDKACKEAGQKRLRPILMSTMTTVFGLLPLALFGDALFVPMAILMLVGLSVAMCVNLILVPIIYEMVFGEK